MATTRNFLCPNCTEPVSDPAAHAKISAIWHGVQGYTCEPRAGGAYIPPPTPEEEEAFRELERNQGPRTFHDALEPLVDDTAVLDGQFGGLSEFGQIVDELIALNSRYTHLLERLISVYEELSKDRTP